MTSDKHAKKTTGRLSSTTGRQIAYDQAHTKAVKLMKDIEQRMPKEKQATPVNHGQATRQDPQGQKAAPNTVTKSIKTKG
jgi:hypothetical protein